MRAMLQIDEFCKIIGAICKEIDKSKIKFTTAVLLSSEQITDEHVPYLVSFPLEKAEMIDITPYRQEIKLVDGVVIKADFVEIVLKRGNVILQLEGKIHETYIAKGRANLLVFVRPEH